MDEIDYEEILFNQNPRPLIITDPKGNILKVNDAFCEHVAIDRNELVGSNTRMFNSGYTDRSVYKSLWTTVKGKKEPWTGNFYNVRKGDEGNPFIEKSSIHPVINKITEEVEYLVGVKEDVTEENERLEKLIYNATRDPLTGLFNKAFFNSTLENLLESAKRNENLLGLFYMDLDGFKGVNDTYGHPVGDLLLKEVSNRLSLCTRKSDILSRIGGDEFAIILNDIKLKNNCITLAEKIISEISKPYELQCGEVNVGISIGIALYDPNEDKALPLDILINLADSALYKVKRSNKGNFAFYD